LFLFVQYLYNTIKIQIKWKTEDNYNKKTKKIYKQTNEKYGNKKKESKGEMLKLAAFGEPSINLSIQRLPLSGRPRDRNDVR